MRKKDSLFIMFVIVTLSVCFQGMHGTKIKFIRFSGKLVSVQLDGTNPYFEVLDVATLHPRQIRCDLETLRSLRVLLERTPDLDIDGKASTPLDGKSTFYCEGKPNVGQRYRVGVPKIQEKSGKWIQGQVIESDPSTGQVVYLGANGRRGYLTVSPEKAEEYRSRIDRMESVEIRGNYRYDRIKRYFVEE